VDPEDPERAFLYRYSGPWMYVLMPFGLVFFGAGVMMLAFGVHGVVKRRGLADIRQTQGDRGWLVRDDWASGRVEASNRSQLLKAWLAGIGIPLFMSVFVVLMATSEDVPGFAKLVVGVFCLFGLLALVQAVLLTIRQIVHGTPVLYIMEVPVAPGSQAAAAIGTRQPVAAERWDLTLECIRKGTVEVGDAREALQQMFQRPDTVDGTTGPVPSAEGGMCIYRRQLAPEGEPRESADGGTMIPLVLDIPADQPATSLDEEAAVTWTLKAKAKVFPWPFSAKFELPVFAQDGEDDGMPDAQPS
jgi:hypothetical protein